MFILEVARGWPDRRWPLNGIFEWDQSKALLSAGHTIVYAALDVRSVRHWRRWGFYRTEEAEIPVFHFDFPIGAVRGLDRAVAAMGFAHILRCVEREFGRPDVVHVHFGDIAASVAGICQRDQMPYVVTEHSSAINVDELPTRILRELKYVYSNAAAVISVSSALARRIRRHTGVEARVIPKIIDLSMFHPTSRQAGYGSRFISAGNLVDGKGFDVLIQAFAVLTRQLPETRLLIMGDGPERMKLGLSEKVVLYGRYRREEFAQKLAESDVFVMASRAETFGVVYVEAMASGLPVIATACGGPEDFVNERNGVLVPVDDVEALGRAMRDTLENRSRYEDTAIANNAARLCSSERVSLMLTSVFREILERENKA